MKRVALLRDMPVEELGEKVAQAKAELAKENALKSSGTRAEKPAKIKNLRRAIARMLTVIKEKKEKAGKKK